MDKIEHFFDEVKKNTEVILATSANNNITMRIVSPVYYKGAILIFTNNDSRKFKQLKLNPNCSISVGHFFVEATAEFLGSTMLPENKDFRDVYSEKFEHAFDENVEFNGRNSDFLLLKPTKLTGWNYEKIPGTQNEVPTTPFEINF